MRTPTPEGSIWAAARSCCSTTYEPLTALPMRRAVIMLLCGKADVVHDDPGRPGDPLWPPGDRGAIGHPVCGPTFRVPYRARIPMTRAALMHRDRSVPTCAHRGARPTPSTTSCRRSRGGEHSWGELRGGLLDDATTARPTNCSASWAGRCACADAPKGQHWRLLCTVKELDPAWVRYLGEGAA